MTALWRWVVLRQIRSATVGLVLLFLFGAPLLAWSLRPSAVSPIDLDLVRSWALPAGWIGIALGLVTLSEGSVFWSRVEARTRFGGELGALLAAGIYLQLPILAAALVAGAPPTELARALPAILTATLQLASVALLLLIPALSSALRASLFLSAVWLVPALCAGDARLGRIAALVDAGLVLRAPGDEAVLRALAASGALVLAAYLLRTGPERGFAT